MEGTTGGDVDEVDSAAMGAQEDLAETIVKATRKKEKTLVKRKKVSSENNHNVGREAEVAVDSVVRTKVVDAIVIIVAEEGGGDHALTPKVKILEREKVSKRSNGKVATASVVVVVDPVDVAVEVVGEVGEGTLAVSTAEGLQEDVLKVTVKEAMSMRGEKAGRTASPSPMRALHKQQI